jgi:hypothetical protein
MTRLEINIADILGGLACAERFTQESYRYRKHHFVIMYFYEEGYAVLNYEHNDEYERISEYRFAENLIGTTTHSICKDIRKKSKELEEKGVRK